MRRKSFSKIYKSLLGGILLTILATGCDNEDFTSSVNDERDAVILSAGAALSVDDQLTTRATNDMWAADDRIGVTMLNTSGSVVPPYTNRQYKATTDGGNVSFVSESEADKMYYPINGNDVTFKAYYPYTGLTDYPNYPLNVSGQANIADLDLMTAVHKNVDGSSTNSKNKKEAHLEFYHQLTLVEVNLLVEEDSPIELENSTLVIKGMKTTGSYNLMNDQLSTDAGSVQDVNIPLSATYTGRAILLPREAGPGAAFEVRTADGGVYTAQMEDGLDLEKGHKYTFNLTLKRTPTLITASIEPWENVPERNYDVVHIVTAQGENEGFEEDAVLRLYAKDAGDTDYSYTKGGSFIFKGAKWTIENPVYWESFTGPVDFKATSVYAEKLNSTQMDDYLVGETPNVDLYNGVHLEMKHAGTKATVKLSSNDGTYTTADLEGATVILPDYFNTGSLNETTGAYTVETSKGDIIPEVPGTTERVAIFPAQTIATDEVLVKVEINGHVYEVKPEAAFTYNQGEHHEIRLNIQKSGVLITTELIDWEPGQEVNAEVRIETTATLGENDNIPDGSQMRLFTEQIPNGGRLDVPGYFTYNATANSWSYSDATHPLVWEDLPNSGMIYGSIENDAVNKTEGYNQSKDYIVATPVENKGGVGNTAIHFEMRHAVSQVKVVLRASDTYTAEQLKLADIYLPGYEYDGKLNKGVYEKSGKIGDIRLDKPNNDEVETRSYLQGQTIPSGETVARVVINGPAGTPRTYNVTYDHDVVYNAGEITHLYITIVGSEVLVSVKVTPWQDQTPVELTYSFNESPTSVEGFEVGEKITFHRLGSDDNVEESKVYVVQDVNGKKELVAEDGTPWFRDDFDNGEKIVAVYPDGTRTDVSVGEKTFDVDLSSGDNRNPSTRSNNIQVASDGVIEDKNANVDLTFKHALSKVTINIIPGDGFATNEITSGDPVVKLVEFMQKGTVDITDGTVSALNTAATFEPNSITANTGAELSYQSLILPQKKDANTTLVKITLNGIEYEAKYPTDFEFKAGQNHVLNITLAKTALKLSATIAEWVDGDSGEITIK